MRQGDLAGDELHEIAARERYGRRRFILALRIEMENCVLDADEEMLVRIGEAEIDREFPRASLQPVEPYGERIQDRKSTRLNSSHVKISYAVFCLKKKNQQYIYTRYN